MVHGDKRPHLVGLQFPTLISLLIGRQLTILVMIWPPLSKMVISLEQWTERWIGVNVNLGGD